MPTVNTMIADPQKYDPIDPPHYKNLKPEPIDVIEGWKVGFNIGCVLKYLSRAGRKGSRLEDLRKASWYLNREISNLENENKS